MSVSENEGKKQPGQNYIYFCSSFSFRYWKTTFADGFQIYRKVFKSIQNILLHLLDILILHLLEGYVSTNLIFKLSEPLVS